MLDFGCRARSTTRCATCWRRSWLRATVRVRNPALSDDTAVLVRSIRALGGQVARERMAMRAGWRASPAAAGGPASHSGGVIQAGNAGAVLRFLLGIGALLPEVRFETDHPGSLGRRPNADLLAALNHLGSPLECARARRIAADHPAWRTARWRRGQRLRRAQLAVRQRAALPRAAACPTGWT